MSKIKELQARVALDYKEIISPFLKLEPKEIINHAYMLAHYNELDDLFENLGEDNDWFSPTVINNMLDYPGNILVGIYHSWLHYTHSEHYNFFTLEDLIDIVSNAFKE